MRRIGFQKVSSTAEGVTAAAGRGPTRRPLKALLPVLVLVAALVVAAGAGAATLSSSGAGATIMSDQEVYSPGQAVRLSGAGWQPGEAVHLFVNDSVGNTWSWSDDVTADDTGAVADSLTLPGSFVATYSIAATGATSGPATSSFFDDSTVISGSATANVGDTKSYTSSKSGGGCTTTAGTWSIQSGSASATIASQTQTAANVTFNAAGTVTLVSTWTGTTNSGHPCNATGTYAVTVSNPAPPDTTPPVITPTVTGTLGDNGWYTSNVSVSWSVTDAESAVSSTSGCNTSNVSTDTSGITFTCSATSAGGSNSQSVTIKRDTTKPTIVDLGATAAPDGEGGWYVSAVTDQFKATDALSGLSSDCVSAFPASGSDNVRSVSSGTQQGLAVKVASGTCTDRAGNQAASSDSAAFKIDLTAPSVTDLGPTASPAGSNGWYVSAVTDQFKATDAVSGLSSGCVAAFPANGSGDNVRGVSSGTQEGSAVKLASGPCTDVAGNTAASIDSAAFKVDLSDPSISFTGQSPDKNANGWNNTDVTLSWSCSDGVSGPVAATVSQLISAEGAGQQATGTCTDNAGRTKDSTDGDVNLDKTKPTVSVTGVSDGATYTLGSVPTAGCVTQDTLSGVGTSSTLSTSGGPVGAVTATCGGAVDKAGNTNSASVTYNVVYSWTGFFQPVDNDPICNSVKAGSAIPVKFSLGGYQGMNIIASGSPSVTTGTCAGFATDPVETTVTAGSSSLSYDSTADQYVYVWKTDKLWAGQAKRLTIKLADGTTHYARFTFTK